MFFLILLNMFFLSKKKALTTVGPRTRYTKKPFGYRVVQRLVIFNVLSSKRHINNIFNNFKYKLKININNTLYVTWLVLVNILTIIIICYNVFSKITFRLGLSKNSSVTLSFTIGFRLVQSFVRLLLTFCFITYLDILSIK